MIFSVFSTAEESYLWGYVPTFVSEDMDWNNSTSQDLILPLMIRTKTILYHRADKEEMRKRGIYLE